LAGEIDQAVATEVRCISKLIRPQDMTSIGARALLDEALQTTSMPHHLSAVLLQFPSHGRVFIKEAEAQAKSLESYCVWCESVTATVEYWKKLQHTFDALDLKSVAQFTSGVIQFYSVSAEDRARFKEDLPAIASDFDECVVQV